MKAVAQLTVVAAFAVLAAATPARAQTNVRMTAIVTNGTVLEVVDQDDEWYKVALSDSQARPRATGFIDANRVEPLDGASGRADGTPTGRPQPGMTAPRPRPRATLARRGIRGFGQLGYGRFAAHQSFESVLGAPGGPGYGGGAELRSGPWTFEGSVERFQRTGERAFVSSGQVFRLGIPDTVTIVPVAGTVGYRQQLARTWSVLGAGGLGRYFYQEASEVAGAVDSFNTQATSYHLRANLEWHRRGPVAVAAEVQYTWVPQALSGGLAASFDEHDLGGLHLRVKVLIGR